MKSNKKQKIDVIKNTAMEFILSFCSVTVVFLLGYLFVVSCSCSNSSPTSRLLEPTEEMSIIDYNTTDANTENAELDPYGNLLYAIRIVESGDDPTAIGDGGKAIGVYQIWEVYWKDAVEFDPTIGGSYRDCYDPVYADRVVRAYLRRYATESRLGRSPTPMDVCRIHNGGPNGFKKNSTISYWERVECILSH